MRLGTCFSAVLLLAGVANGEEVLRTFGGLSTVDGQYGFQTSTPSGFPTTFCVGKLKPLATEYRVVLIGFVGRDFRAVTDPAKYAFKFHLYSSGAALPGNPAAGDLAHVSIPAPAAQIPYGNLRVVNDNGGNPRPSYLWVFGELNWPAGITVGSSERLCGIECLVAQPSLNTLGLVIGVTDLTAEPADSDLQVGNATTPTVRVIEAFEHGNDGVLATEIWVQGASCKNPKIFADFDNDGDVDASDFGLFQRCLNITGPVPYDCSCADANLDGAVDQADYERFELCASGPAVPASPSCDDPEAAESVLISAGYHSH